MDGRLTIEEGTIHDFLDLCGRNMATFEVHPIQRFGNRLSLNRIALELAPASGGGTEVSYSMEFNLYGRMATLGSSVVKRKTEDMRVEFTRAIVKELGG